MVKILEYDHIHYGTQFDYHLEDGERLHSSEWNGEDYTIKTGATKGTVYKPVYDETPNENDGYDILGFEKGT